MLRTTTIEEGIYDINTKESIKKAIFTFDGERLTRQLFYDSNKIDVIDGTSLNIKLTLSDMLNYEVNYDNIIENIKKRVKEFDVENVEKRNIDAELPFFKNPIITIR